MPEIKLEEVIAEIRKAFEEELSNPTPNQIDIMMEFDKACVKGIAIYARKNNIVLD